MKVILRCGLCNAANSVERSRVYQAVCGRCKHSLLFSPDMTNLPPEEVPDADPADDPDDDFDPDDLNIPLAWRLR